MGIISRDITLQFIQGQLEDDYLVVDYACNMYLCYIILLFMGVTCLSNYVGVLPVVSLCNASLSV